MDENPDRTEREPPRAPPVPISIKLNASGADQEDRNRIDTGMKEGTLVLNYDMFAVPDRLTVYYQGVRVHDTGLVSNQGTVSVKFGPGTATVVEIVMNEGQGAAGTIWELSGVVLPKGVTDVQTVTITPTRGGPGAPGTFSLTFQGNSTALLPVGASAADVQAALNALPSIGGVGGLAAVTSGGNVYYVTFGGALSPGKVPQMSGLGAGGVTVQVAKVR